MKRRHYLMGLATVLLLAGAGVAEVTLTPERVEQAPRVDGVDDDPAWQGAREVTVHDPIADLDIRLKTVRTADQIFFLVRFADRDESRLHKPWVWSDKTGMYDMGPLREDAFVFKWAMSPKTKDLSITAAEDYSADIWFWKAHRTDPSGVADDKIQTLHSEPVAQAREVISKDGRRRYFTRHGDTGTSAYEPQLLIDFAGPQMPQFHARAPSGSRADIRAKGLWREGAWCIEFSRALRTGHDDDIQFEVGKRYLFGVSRLEVAGREPDPTLSQPLYGSGDTAGGLRLVLEP